MTNRKRTPDIMADLMPGTNQIINKQKNQQAIKPEGNKAVSIASNKAIKPALHKTITEDPKEKATFNLSSATFEALEEAWLNLRRSMPCEDFLKQIKPNLPLDGTFH
jgi:hypothetical protein